MKKNVMMVCALSLALVANAGVQDSLKKALAPRFEPSGKVTGDFYMNYHYDFTKNVEKVSQFEIQRAYLGYNYSFTEKINTRILFDMGNDGKEYSVFLKNAFIEYKHSKTFAIEAGMNSTHMWDTQDKFFGYRYVLESILDLAKFYSSTDIGMKMTYKPIDMIELHAGLYNGDGFKKLQDNFGMHRVSFDIVANPIKGLTFKTYVDYAQKQDTAIKKKDLLQDQISANVFVGYEKKDVFRVGVEYGMQTNSAHVKDQQIGGMSVFGAYTKGKYEVFARYDQLASNTLTGKTDPWNVSKDYSLIMCGVQYSPIKGIKTSLNFRNFTPRKEGVEPLQYVYVNLNFKF